MNLKQKYEREHGKYYKWKFSGIGKTIHIPIEVITFPSSGGSSFLCPKINKDLSVSFIIAELNTPSEFGYSFDGYVDFYCSKQGKKYYLNVN